MMNTDGTRSFLVPYSSSPLPSRLRYLLHIAMILLRTLLKAFFPSIQESS